MDDKTKAKIIKIRKMLQKNAPSIYKRYAMRKLVQKKQNEK